MKKFTNEQAIKAINEATTQEAIEATLNQCTKAQLHEVYRAIMGEHAVLGAKSSRKGELIAVFTARLLYERKQEAVDELRSRLIFAHEAITSSGNLYVASAIYQLLRKGSIRFVGPRERTSKFERFFMTLGCEITYPNANYRDRAKRIGMVHLAPVQGIV